MEFAEFAEFELVPKRLPKNPDIFLLRGFIIIVVVYKNVYVAFFLFRLKLYILLVILLVPLEFPKMYFVFFLNPNIRLLQYNN